MGSSYTGSFSSINDEQHLVMSYYLQPIFKYLVVDVVTPNNTCKNIPSKNHITVVITTGILVIYDVIKETNNVNK